MTPIVAIGGFIIFPVWTLLLGLDALDKDEPKAALFFFGLFGAAITGPIYGISQWFDAGNSVNINMVAGVTVRLALLAIVMAVAVALIRLVLNGSTLLIDKVTIKPEAPRVWSLDEVKQITTMQYLISLRPQSRSTEMAYMRKRVAEYEATEES